MFSKKRKFGNLGEKIAGEWLKNKGFYIVETNYLKKWGEVDIIAQKDGILRFIEVKTVKRNLKSEMKNKDRYKPYENVHSKKIERLHRTIQSYLMENSFSSQNQPEIDKSEWQIDIAAVYIDEEHKLAKVEMIENIA